MTIIKCDATDCVNNKDGECEYKGYYHDISMVMTASGFYPICQEYKEKPYGNEV